MVVVKKSWNPNVVPKRAVTSFPMETRVELESSDYRIEKKDSQYGSEWFPEALNREWDWGGTYKVKERRS